jgi:hypothetical protein
MPAEKKPHNFAGGAVGYDGRIAREHSTFPLNTFEFVDMFRRPAQALLACCTAVALAGHARAAEPADGVRTKTTLAEPTSVAWDNTPLVYALSSLADARRLTIVRDRRIDPQRPLTLTVHERPLSSVLDEIAKSIQHGYSQFGPVAYLGPVETAKKLRTLAALRLDDAGRLPAATRRRLLAAKSWHWDRLAEPRKLAQELAAEAGVTLSNPDRIPHDLWPGGDLPPLSWIDRLSLLLAQFDLTFRIGDGGRRVEIVEIPASVTLARSYAGGANAPALAQRWREALPDAEIAAAGNQIRVTAALEDHERLEARLRAAPTRRTRVAAGKQTYQLSVENAALDKVVAQLEKQLELEFEWDWPAIDQAGIAVDQQITVKVSGASLEQLLDAVFADTGLGFARQGRQIRVGPKR